MFLNTFIEPVCIHASLSFQQHTPNLSQRKSHIVKSNDNMAKVRDLCTSHRCPTVELFTLLNGASHVSSLS